MGLSKLFQRRKKVRAQRQVLSAVTPRHLAASCLTFDNFNFFSACNSTPNRKHEPFVESLGTWKQDWQALSFVPCYRDGDVWGAEQFISTFSNPSEQRARKKTSTKLIAPTDNDD